MSSLSASLKKDPSNSSGISDITISIPLVSNPRLFDPPENTHVPENSGKETTKGKSSAPKTQVHQGCVTLSFEHRFLSHSQLLEIKDACSKRWLRGDEIFRLLHSLRYLKLPISEKPVSHPPSGSFFFFPRSGRFRDDGYNYARKKVNSGYQVVKEHHVKLQISKVHVISAYYAKRDDNKNFERRIYWLVPFSEATGNSIDLKSVSATANEHPSFHQAARNKPPGLTLREISEVPIPERPSETVDFATYHICFVHYLEVAEDSADRKTTSKGAAYSSLNQHAIDENAVSGYSNENYVSSPRFSSTHESSHLSSSTPTDLSAPLFPTVDQSAGNDFGSFLDVSPFTSSRTMHGAPKSALSNITFPSPSASPSLFTMGYSNGGVSPIIGSTSHTPRQRSRSSVSGTFGFLPSASVSQSGNSFLPPSGPTSAYASVDHTPSRRRSKRTPHHGSVNSGATVPESLTLPAPVAAALSSFHSRLQSCPSGQYSATPFSTPLHTSLNASSFPIMDPPSSRLSLASTRVDDSFDVDSDIAADALPIPSTATRKRTGSFYQDIDLDTEHLHDPTSFSTLNDLNINTNDLLDGDDGSLLGPPKIRYSSNMEPGWTESVESKHNSLNGNTIRTRSSTRTRSAPVPENGDSKTTQTSSVSLNASKPGAQLSNVFRVHSSDSQPALSSGSSSADGFSTAGSLVPTSVSYGNSLKPSGSFLTISGYLTSTLNGSGVVPGAAAFSSARSSKTEMHPAIQRILNVQGDTLGQSDSDFDEVTESDYPRSGTPPQLGGVAPAARMDTSNELPSHLLGVNRSLVYREHLDLDLDENGLSRGRKPTGKALGIELKTSSLLKHVAEQLAQYNLAMTSATTSASAASSSTTASGSPPMIPLSRSVSNSSSVPSHGLADFVSLNLNLGAAGASIGSTGAKAAATPTNPFSFSLVQGIELSGGPVPPQLSLDGSKCSGSTSDSVKQSPREPESPRFNAEISNPTGNRPRTLSYVDRQALVDTFSSLSLQDQCAVATVLATLDESDEGSTAQSSTKASLGPLSPVHAPSALPAVGNAGIPDTLVDSSLTSVALDAFHSSDPSPASTFSASGPVEESAGSAAGASVPFMPGRIGTRSRQRSWAASKAPARPQPLATVAPCVEKEDAAPTSPSAPGDPILSGLPRIPGEHAQLLNLHMQQMSLEQRETLVSDVRLIQTSVRKWLAQKSFVLARTAALEMERVSQETRAISAQNSNLEDFSSAEFGRLTPMIEHSSSALGSGSGSVAAAMMDPHTRAGAGLEVNINTDEVDELGLAMDMDIGSDMDIDLDIDMNLDGSVEGTRNGKTQSSIEEITRASSTVDFAYNADCRMDSPVSILAMPVPLDDSNVSIHESNSQDGPRLSSPTLRTTVVDPNTGRSETFSKTPSMISLINSSDVDSSGPHSSVPLQFNRDIGYPGLPVGTVISGSNSGNHSSSSTGIGSPVNSSKSIPVPLDSRLIGSIQSIIAQRDAAEVIARAIEKYYANQPHSRV